MIIKNEIRFICNLNFCINIVNDTFLIKKINKALFLLFAIVSAQPTSSMREILGAVREISRFGVASCRLRFGRSLCSFARKIRDLVLDIDLVGESSDLSSNPIDDEEGKNLFILILNIIY